MLLTWISGVFNLLPMQWTQGIKSETEVSSSMHPDSELLADLTKYITKEFTYATAQGSFGDVWKCRCDKEDKSFEVAVKCVRIDIPDEHFKGIVNKRLIDDFSSWKQLEHELPAIVSPWMHNGSLNTYLDKHYDDLTETHKLRMLADVAAGLQYLHSKGASHGDLTGNNVLINRNGRARIADYGVLTTCSDLNGTSYIRSNVRWAASELFEVPDTDDSCSSPKIESDVYSFGCIMYQVLSGHQPYYDIRSDHQVVVTILRGIKPKRPAVPVIEDVTGTLSNDVGSRYQGDLQLLKSGF